MYDARWLYATAPDGSLVRRHTHRDYAFAVVTRSYCEPGTWVLLSMHESHAAAKRRKGGDYRKVVVPVRDTREE
jgi:hypothetical protein